jgi:predicted DCC family thiol-disulfide oxidoreductase YuxK
VKTADSPTPSGVYYDGNCPLCMRAVKFIGNHSRAGQFQFYPLQEARENRIPGIADMDTDSLVFIHNNQLFTESEAVLRLVGKLKFPWNFLKIFLFLPAKWRDVLYRFVARNRQVLYRGHGIAGKKQHIES